MEESLREFEQRVAELKSKAESLQSDQVSKQELLKLQVRVRPARCLMSLPFLSLDTHIANYQLS